MRRLESRRKKRFCANWQGPDCDRPLVCSLSRARERVGVRAGIFDEVKAAGVPAPALTPGPSPASGRGEPTGSGSKRRWA
ncbi:hypothetical protein CBM2587_A160171 [Cupriavidus taiwanensis]|uniref:Uncharacterized protein n=1 Tax=Cupriavidus taiwanensis TaxID=164546 RepID=A0A975WVQ7_9BURK|nr:hypothetical protein CBM2587_A160171 [Cupriavidus taiwanensis]